MKFTLTGWRFGVVVTRWSRLTKLLYAGPGYYRDGWPVRGWTPGAVNLSVCNQPSRSTQLGHPFLGRRSEYQPLWLHSLVCVLLHTTPQIHKECTWLVSAWNCPLTPIFGRILEHSSPNDVTHCTSSEKDTHSLEKRCLETHGLSWMAWKSVQRLKLGVSSRKAAGQSKESWRGYISPISRSSPTEPIWTRVCMGIDVPGVIICARFQNEIFRVYDFTGVKFFTFPVIFGRALQLTTLMCCLWFCRGAECKLSLHVYRLREHIEDTNKLPILIFPEGQ